MKFNFQNKITIAFFLMVLQVSFAQKKEENIGSEVVNVVKPYTAAISDALRPETPVLDDEGMQKKKPLNILFSLSCCFYFYAFKRKS
jgi:hypothetical protein